MIEKEITPKTENGIYEEQSDAIHCLYCNTLKSKSEMFNSTMCLSCLRATQIQSSEEFTKVLFPEDSVSHPKHYTSHPAGIECITVIEHFPCNIANAMKYLWRCGLKEGNQPEVELRKALWYVEREISRLATLQKEN